MAVALPSTVKKAVRGAEKGAVAAGAKVLGRLPAAGTFPGGEVLLAQEAVRRNRGFVPRAKALMEGKSRPRGNSLPLLILSNLPHSEVEIADIAAREGFATPDFLDRVAARAAADGDIAAAIRLRRRAVELDPETAHRHVALAQTLHEDRTEGVVHDWILGLAKGTVPAHSDEALAHFARAYELAPSNPYVMHEYGAALIAAGKVEQALPLLEMAALKRPQEGWLLELAETYRRPDIAKFEKAMTYYERVFQLNPRNMKALSGLINAGTRGPMDWARIWRSVHTLETRKKKTATPYEDLETRAQLDSLFQSPDHPATASVDSLIANLERHADMGSLLHPTTLGLVIARLQFARYFGAGFALRERLARERLAELRSKPVIEPSKLRQLLKAHAYLDDAETAATLADGRFWGTEKKFERQQIEKMHADARLLLGDPAPYIDYSRKARKRMPLTADDTMSDLLKGKRVALVGPAETGDRLGSVIDEYDVIVRPRYQPEFIAENREAQGSRTDITYYSGQDLTSLFESIAGAAEAGDVKVVNARPFSHAAHAHRDLPWLRFYRQDFSLTFHGGSLGIQRMAYDLLQFEPAEICVFNSDLYTGNSMFTTGWRQGDTFAPYSHINDIVISHDVKWEFKFMKALMSTGIVTAQGRAAEVLAQTPDEYVRAVEEAGVLR